MKVTIWGTRGSVPSPGPETVRYGGNTSCVQVTLSDGTVLALDAGTGIRNMGLALGEQESPINILLTHLHMDHIQGLMFFAPAFNPACEIAIWGPQAPDAPLRDRIARYISAPLSPVEVRELPCHVSFHEASESEWEIGTATVRAVSVTHRGPTLGYRITEGETSLCYIPDHEPALGSRLEHDEPEWISGFGLAHQATLLLHDGQYTDEEYSSRVGWGHSRLEDALVFSRRVEAERVLLCHHDPLHSDELLDGLQGAALDRWAELGGEPARLELAWERQELTIRPARPASAW